MSRTEGAQPRPKRTVPLNDCTFDNDEIQAAIDVLRSGRITMGPLCARFEEEFAKYLGVKNALFVNSGSSANLLAAFALANPLLQPTRGKRRLEPGSEVIVPSVTWSTTIWPIVQAGATPVLVDCDPTTLQMDLDAVERALSKKTVAICPVHVLGNAVPMERLVELADDRGLWLIEDTCESLGTQQNGRFTGTFGDIGTYSFYFSHHITTIEGGMVVTNDDELADLMRCLRAHGWTRHMKSREKVEAQHPEIDPRFLFVNTGFNLRPTEVNAAFGVHQLPKLRAMNQRRREIVGEWNSAFADLGEQFKAMQRTEGTEPTWFGYPIICKSQVLRDKLRDHLEGCGIETRPVICGNLARQPAFKLIPHRISGELAGADKVMDQGLFWGCHPGMKRDDVDYVIDTVRNFFEVPGPFSGSRSVNEQ